MADYRPRFTKQCLAKRCLTMRSVAATATLVSVLFAANGVAEQPVLELESTIKGNQEQPKVLYIVPWQAQSAPPLGYRPLQSLIQAHSQMIDRDEFRREIALKRQWNKPAAQLIETVSE